jgi:hypothetical protein
MYALIIAIHAIFIGIAHLLWYRVIEGIFFLLGIFFLFYFSPLFFIDDDEKKWRKDGAPLSPKDILTRLSPKNSLLLPMILMYIAIYGFFFALLPNNSNILLFHAIIVSAIFLIFIWYSIAFYWKNDVFFELLRFHTLFTLISTIVFTLSLLLEPNSINILHPVIWFIWVLAGTFLLSYTRQESPVFLWSYLAGIFATLIVVWLWAFPDIRMISLCAIAIFSGIFIFEYFPRFTMFYTYSTAFRYFILVVILLFLLPVAYIAIDSVDSLAITLLAVSAGFFLTIHRRYTNYVVYIVAILEIFIVYALLFSWLLVHPSLSTLFLFLFFLPVLIIGTTYFWDEDHAYDFILLHYSSIAFSVIYSLYAIFFIWWGGDILFVVSLSIFGIALLFFMSYFRLREEKKIHFRH